MSEFYICRQCGSDVRDDHGIATPYKPYCSIECRDNWYRLGHGRYRNSFPCLDCNKFLCQLGQARCELCEYGHTAEWCPERIDVSNVAKTEYVHGPCKGRAEMAKQPKDVLTKVTWQRGSTRYTAEGHIQSVDALPWQPGAASGDITIKMVGTFTSEIVHTDPHFEHSRHGSVCVCECPNCLSIDNDCVCEGCNHGEV